MLKMVNLQVRREGLDRGAFLERWEGPTLYVEEAIRPDDAAGVGVGADGAN